MRSCEAMHRCAALLYACVCINVQPKAFGVGVVLPVSFFGWLSALKKQAACNVCIEHV